jgi:hypothetical protein
MRLPSFNHVCFLSSMLVAGTCPPGVLASPPANDDCHNAIVMTNTQYAVTSLDVTDATVQSCEATAGACDAGSTHSVWWRFTAPQDGPIAISAFGTNFTAVMSVFDGCAVSILGGCAQPVALSCDIDGNNGPFDFASAFLDVQAGQTLLFRVASMDGTGGTMDLYFYYAPEVPNDACGDATPITGAIFQDEILITEAEDDECEALPVSCNAQPPVRSVWYRYDAVASGTLHLSTVGSTFDSVITAYDNCPQVLPPLGCGLMPAQLVCAIGLANLGASVNLPVVAGMSYAIRIAAVEGTDEYLARFSTRFIPANDTCGQARLIGFDTFNPALLPIGGAGVTMNEPQEDCDTLFVTNSVFYRYTPALDGAASINTLGSTYDTVLSVFDGCGQPVIPNGYIQPTLLACHNDVGGLLGSASNISALPMLAGETYIIKVATNGPTAPDGLLDFNFQYTAGQVCAGDIAGGKGGTGDGAVNIDDLLAVISAWGACPAPPTACPANIITSGASATSVDIDDLLAVISAWGPCP